MANLRVGLIGLGMMGRHHARVLRELPGVDLVAVADAYGDPHGVAGGLTVLSSVEELIAQGLDMAVAAVPTGMHEEVGLALAEAGVHTLVEKPIAKVPRRANASWMLSKPKISLGLWATSSGSTLRCSRCGRGSKLASSVRFTRLPPAGRVPSRRASPTSGL